MKAVADTLGVSRSNLIERLKCRSKPRGSYHKAEDAELLPIIRRLVCRAMVPAPYRTKEILENRRGNMARNLTGIGSKISVEPISSAPSTAAMSSDGTYTGVRTSRTSAYC